MRATIFINGLVSDYDVLRPWLRADDYVICADGGTVHCLALGKRPHVIVGDLDSVEPATLSQLQVEGVVIERHAVNKDQTDLELAIERAVVDGADEILLFGAMGGRLDQAIANVLILAQRNWPAPIKLVEGNQIAQILRGQETLVLENVLDSTLSVIPLSDRVTGITYTGMRFPLRDATLMLGSTRGVSNVVTASPATMQIDSGTLLVIQTVDNDPAAQTK